MAPKSSSKPKYLPFDLGSHVSGDPHDGQQLRQDQTLEQDPASGNRFEVSIRAKSEPEEEQEMEQGRPAMTIPDKESEKRWGKRSKKDIYQMFDTEINEVGAPCPPMQHSKFDKIDEQLRLDPDRSHDPQYLQSMFNQAMQQVRQCKQVALQQERERHELIWKFSRSEAKSDRLRSWTFELFNLWRHAKEEQVNAEQEAIAASLNLDEKLAAHKKKVDADFKALNKRSAAIKKEAEYATTLYDDAASLFEKSSGQPASKTDTELLTKKIEADIKATDLKAKGMQKEATYQDLIKREKALVERELAHDQVFRAEVESKRLREEFIRGTEVGKAMSYTDVWQTGYNSGYFWGAKDSARYKKGKLKDDDLHLRLEQARAATANEWKAMLDSLHEDMKLILKERDEETDGRHAKELAQAVEKERRNGDDRVEAVYKEVQQLRRVELREHNHLGYHKATMVQLRKHTDPKLPLDNPDSEQMRGAAIGRIIYKHKRDGTFETSLWRHTLGDGLFSIQRPGDDRNAEGYLGYVRSGFYAEQQRAEEAARED